MHARLVPLLVATFLGGLAASVACGPKGDRELGEDCDESPDCAEGLFCADEGPLAGQCTRDCEPIPDECGERFGDGAFCNGNGTCALHCAEDSDCPGNTHCVNEACDR